MSWVVRIKGYLGGRGIGKLTAAIVSAISIIFTSAKAFAITGINPLDRVVQPMYGVPVVKYGPPPSVTPIPVDPGTTIGQPITTFFDWGTTWAPTWSFQKPATFSMPDFSSWSPSFPKFVSMVAMAAYTALILYAACGWILRGSAWYLKNKK
jgi:hypothetical protein